MSRFEAIINFKVYKTYCAIYISHYLQLLGCGVSGAETQVYTDMLQNYLCK